MEVTVEHLGNKHFKGKGGSQFPIDIDARVSAGGSELGPTPMELMLMAVAGCSGMDVVSILDKMRIHFNQFKIIVNGEQAEDYPKVIIKAEIRFCFWGSILPEDKIKQAIELSLNKYCGASNTIKPVTKITYSVEIHSN